MCFSLACLANKSVEIQDPKCVSKTYPNYFNDFEIIVMKLITIDGPAGSGKGTIAKQLSQELKLNYLDSGAIYRILGFI